MTMKMTDEQISQLVDERCDLELKLLDGFGVIAAEVEAVSEYSNQDVIVMVRARVKQEAVQQLIDVFDKYGPSYRED